MLRDIDVKRLKTTLGVKIGLIHCLGRFGLGRGKTLEPLKTLSKKRLFGAYKTCHERGGRAMRHPLTSFDMDDNCRWYQLTCASNQSLRF